MISADKNIKKSEIVRRLGIHRESVGRIIKIFDN